LVTELHTQMKLRTLKQGIFFGYKILYVSQQSCLPVRHGVTTSRTVIIANELLTNVGRDTAVGPGIESRWGVRFSAPVQTAPRNHPASNTMGTGSFPGVKRPGCGFNHPHHLQTKLKKEKSYTSTPPLVLRCLL
jgi:hypothetical protein